MNETQKFYREFLKTKQIVNKPIGFKINENDINPILFDHQKDAVLWSLKNGTALNAFDVGLGKTGIQLEWCRILSEHFNKPALILTPLGVSFQMKKEAEELLNIEAKIIKEKNDIINGVNITNYEKLHKFDRNSFICLAVDESSIIKNFAGKFKKQLIDFSKNIKYKISLSATPSPNDFTEIGNQSEFLDIMDYNEMLSCFFINDTKNTTKKWRLKKHAKKDFYLWLSSWALMVRKPSDLGYSDEKYDLSDINYIEHCFDKSNDSFLTQDLAKGLNEVRKINRETMNDRCCVASDIVNNSNETFMIWCNLNDEADILKKEIKDCVEVRGSHSNEFKEEAIIAFLEGKIKRLVSKSKIFGFGINAQYVCNNAVYVGLNYSMEMLYQSIKRIHRFGQTKDVNIHLIYSEREGNVLNSLKNKQRNFDDMHNEMKCLINIKEQFEFNLYKKDKISYNNKIILPKFI
jgi:hypothetical protein